MVLLYNEIDETFIELNATFLKFALHNINKYGIPLKKTPSIPDETKTLW